MRNEFKIKNGFISEGDSKVNGTLSAQTINITTALALNNSATDILVKNNSTGMIEYRPVSGNFNATSMGFKLDAGSTTILLLHLTTEAILDTYPTNSMVAVANGVDIRIQLIGGEKILIDALDLSTINIDGTLVTQVQVTAINELNALFANAGISNNPPTITPASISLTPTQSINFTPTGTDVVTWTYDSLPTE